MIVIKQHHVWREGKTTENNNQQAQSLQKDCVLSATGQKSRFTHVKMQEKRLGHKEKPFSHNK